MPAPKEESCRIDLYRLIIRALIGVASLMVPKRLLRKKHSCNDVRYASELIVLFNTWMRSERKKRQSDTTTQRISGIKSVTVIFSHRTGGGLALAVGGGWGVGNGCCRGDVGGDGGAGLERGGLQREQAAGAFLLVCPKSVLNSNTAHTSARRNVRDSFKPTISMERGLLFDRVSGVPRGGAQSSGRLILDDAYVEQLSRSNSRLDCIAITTTDIHVCLCQLCTLSGGKRYNKYKIRRGRCSGVPWFIAEG